MFVSWLSFAGRVKVIPLPSCTRQTHRVTGGFVWSSRSTYPDLNFILLFLVENIKKVYDK